MMRTKLCVECKSKIHRDAIKCLSCNSRQNWTRFLDIGNTSLSLLIAALSVGALTIDNIATTINLLKNNAKTIVSIKILEANPKEILVYFYNSGHRTTTIKQGALCSIWPTKNKDVTFSKTEIAKYPEPQQVVGRYFYIYETDRDDKYVTLSPGENKILKFTFSEIASPQPLNLPKTKEIKSYCFFYYLNEDGQDGGAIDFLDPLSIQSYSTDENAAKKAMESYKGN